MNMSKLRKIDLKQAGWKTLFCLSFVAIFFVNDNMAYQLLWTGFWLSMLYISSKHINIDE